MSKPSFQPTQGQSGFGESRFTADNTLFHEGNEWVSLDQFVTGGKHYPVLKIRAAEVRRGKRITLNTLAIFAAGLVVLYFQLYAGLAVLAGTVLFWVGRKPYYQLILNVSGRTVKAMACTDGKRLTRIHAAIVEAVEYQRAAAV